MIAKDGLVKILDFGLAKLFGESDVTRTNSTVGTVAYMSPEQIRGGDVDSRTDVWAFGVVLYEMLAGRRPFEGKDDLAVLSGILDDMPQPVGKLRDDVPAELQQIVARCLDKNAASRYRSATELLKDLTACRAAMTERTRAADVLRLLRRPVVAIPALALLIAVGLLAAAAITRGNRERWAREEAIPQIIRLVETDKFVGAFELAKEVERYIPNDPVLAGLWPQLSAAVSITTSPDGADVYVRDYAAADDRWEYLGRTPIKRVRLPRGTFQFRVEKEGYEAQVLAATNPSSLLQNASSRLAKPISISLVRKGTTPEMVRVPGGAFPVSLARFSTDELTSLEAFSIDRHEVTNKAFKRFVDGGGYASQEYWRSPSFVKDGRQLTSQEAIAQFRDSTDRPGPAGWELGEYSPGQDDFPVGGVSWHEAEAYCRSEGKTLPTIFHWARAALSPDEMFSPLAQAIIPLSNFTGKGPAPVGRFRGIGPYGTYDMGGNVREWCWNESTHGRRWILGGGWNDPEWMLIQQNSLPPLDRSATNGFRCAQYGATIPDRLLASVTTSLPDYRSAKAVSDEVFEVFTRQFSYAQSALSERVESRDTSGKDWIREKISFDAGYESGRVPAYLFLPRNAQRPYQLAIGFPGLSAFIGRASSENLQPAYLDFIVKGGRALVWPIYKGSYERWDPFLNLQGEESRRTYRLRMPHWRQDLGRVLDVLSGRQDIDTNAVAYIGASFGASMPIPLLAVERRLKVAVLLAPGFTYREMPPEANGVNYASRVTLPILMLGGRYDYVLPLEESQKPLFERLGTPAEHKRHVVYAAGHGNFPRSEMIREVLGWLDRYLGPVRGATQAQSQ